MSKEAMNLALEALKTLVERFDYEQFTSVCELDDAKDAIKALEEALAKQEQDQYAKGYADAMNWKTANHLEHLPAKQEQCTGCEGKPSKTNNPCEVCGKKKQEQGEPVALEAIYETIIYWDEGGGKRSRRELARRIVALYTTPQQRTWVGLTDEQKQTAIWSDGSFGSGVLWAESKLKENNQ